MIKLTKIKADHGFDLIQAEGIEAAQKWGTQNLFKRLQERYPDIERVVEVGTWHGGFSLVLRSIFDNVHTFDIHDYGHSGKLLEHGVHFYLRDIFESNQIINLIREPGRVLVLCDGGHKHNEITFLIPSLKKGDLIGAHDYSPDGVATHWVTSEINNSMISEFCDHHQVVEVMPECNLFAWTIREKQ